MSDKMSIKERTERLQVLVPGCEYVTRGDTLEWLDERPMPSKAEIEAVDLAGAQAADEARETLRRLERELCDGCEALMEHIGPERMPEVQRERLEAKRAARERIQRYENGNGSDTEDTKQ